MVAVWEYRIVLPFTVEEYKIAQLYMVAKYSASESNAENGDGVEVLRNEPYEDGDRRGQYTHKVYHLASKLPTWLVALMPKKALTLEEVAWNAYPYCTTILTCPFFNKFRLILKTTHQEDRGTAENALGLDGKTLKKRQVEYIDISTDPVETYVEDEDPAKFRSRRTGRGPLKAGWTEKCEPVMCAYKCVTVDVPYYWGFSAQIEKFIAKNAQRKVLLDGHRKCFCWLDEWHGLTMEDIRRMEIETEEAMAKVRQIALRRADREAEVEAGVVVAGVAESLVDESIHEDLPLTPPARGTPILMPNSSRSNTPRSASGSPMLLRRPSLVGPSIAVGIATVSASDLDNFSLGGSTPPALQSQFGSLSLEEQKKLAKDLEKDQDLPDTVQSLLRSGSSESFSSFHSHHRGAAAEEDALQLSNLGDKSELAQYCVDVLDRAINWTKQRTKNSPGGSTKASGKITPVHSKGANGDEVMQSEERDVEHCVGVLANALSVVQKRPSKGSLS